MGMALSPRAKWLVLAALAVLIVGIGVGAWLYLAREAGQAGAFPLNRADTISSWSFTGAYAGNDTLIAQANTDAGKLRALLGNTSDEYDDYDLYVGIGNDANLIGDGKAAFAAYNKASAIHPEKGLAYANIGHLMDELGAYQTAADAYTKAVSVEPAQLEYHVERLNFLATRLPKDTARIEEALTDAGRQFGDTPAILSIEAQWLEGQGRYKDAITAWETVRMLSPSDRQPSIDAQIARDRAKMQ